MRSMSDTLARLARLQALQNDPAPAASPLVPLESFGSNPGALEAYLHVPRSLSRRAGLVVALHGCTQTAASYDEGTGWSRLAEDYGFAVLLPQQTRQNNANTCFNWFVKEDIRRSGGEAQSIRQMIEAVVQRHDIDPGRIFVTGLSAGGAMANAMLATYPEVFAGGAIIAGLPYGTAGSVSEAFDRMRGHGIPDAARLRDILQSSSTHRGPWPTVSVWHGTRDNTVLPVNGEAIVAQWRGVHGIDAAASHQDTLDGHSVTAWKDEEGRTVVEHISVTGLAHATPIDLTDGYGRGGPYILDAGISSTVSSARSWGLIPSFEKRTGHAAGTHRAERNPEAPEEPMGIQKIIETALKSAGLMR